MNSFQTSFDTNFSDMNKVILSFWTSLQNEKEALSELRFRLQKDNVDDHISIDNSIITLQKILAHENIIMDALVDSTMKIVVLKEHLKSTTLDLGKENKELLLVKGKNFQIN